MPGLLCPVCGRVDYLQDNISSHLWTSHRKADLITTIEKLVREKDESRAAASLSPPPFLTRSFIVDSEGQ